jgi:hypothetical protein
MIVKKNQNVHDEFSYNIQNAKNNKVAVRVLQFHGKEILMDKARMQNSIEQGLSFDSDPDAVLRRFMAGFLIATAQIPSRPDHVGFVVYKAAVG